MSDGAKVAIVSTVGIVVLANVIVFFGKFKQAISALANSVHKTSQSCKNTENK